MTTCILRAFGAATVLVGVCMVPLTPVYGQSCTPSADTGEAARSGASLTNPEGTTIVVSRRGERGLDATASATNHGTVVTCGEVHEFLRGDGTPARRRAHAVHAGSESGGGAAGNNSGLIETRGRGARGLNVWEYGETATATATATNRGRIVTRGDFYDGSVHFGHPHIRTPDGILADSGPNAGDAVAVNERNSANDPQSGVIEVLGTGARGIWAYTGGTGEARGINRGDITTHGDAFALSGGYVHNAAGVSAESVRGSATAINERGATIRTHGDGAPGLFAAIYEPHHDTGNRTARAENRGTVVVAGDSIISEYEDDDGEVEDDSLFTSGVEAMADDDGSAIVVNTGDVTASGSIVGGLVAHDGSYGDGGDLVNVEVRMTGGSVVAGRRDNPGTPEDESGRGLGIYAATNTGNANVTVSGESTTVTAYGTDDPDTDDVDESGLGILAAAYETGSASVEVSGGATVTADTAVEIHGHAAAVLNLYESRLNGKVNLMTDGGNSHFTIRGGTVYGDVDLYGGNDILSITGDSRITGDINFGEGTDTLIFHGPGTLDTIVEGQITGLENLFSTAERAHVLPLLPAASGAQQGFVRIVNTSDEAGEVEVRAFDDAGTEYGPLTLAIGAGEVRHFNSHDLETGNAAKGLTGATGPGEGRWRLVFESDLGIRVMGYVRTADGFLTSMHDEVTETASDEGYRYEVVFFNPASNTNQVSVLRVVNRSDAEAAVTITGLDDAGEAGEEAVELTLPAGAARMLAALELESGGDDLEGALGDRVGKWRLTVASDRPLSVMSLLRSPTGHLTNLSTVPPASR